MSECQMERREGGSCTRVHVVVFNGRNVCLHARECVCVHIYERYLQHVRSRQMRRLSPSRSLAPSLLILPLFIFSAKRLIKCQDEVP